MVINQMYDLWYDIGRWIYSEQDEHWFWWQLDQRYATVDRARKARDELVDNVLAYGDGAVDLVSSPYLVVRIEKWENVHVIEDDV